MVALQGDPARELREKGGAVGLGRDKRWVRRSKEERRLILQGDEGVLVAFQGGLGPWNGDFRGRVEWE